MLKLPMCVVVVVLAPTVLWAEEFDDFDTEIFTTSLVQEGEEVEGLHLNVYRAIRGAKENPELAIGVSPSFADVRIWAMAISFALHSTPSMGTRTAIPVCDSMRSPTTTTISLPVLSGVSSGNSLLSWSRVCTLRRLFLDSTTTVGRLYCSGPRTVRLSSWSIN